MNKDLLSNISKKLVAPKKGVLAADESNPTIKKRFDSIGIESNENYRRNYRDLLFSTQNLEEYISGVILYEETLYQKNSKGQSLTKILSDKGIIPGIKVDKGAKEMIGFKGETITEGLDGLYDRVKKYYDDGAGFSKWRAVISIGDLKPSMQSIQLNAVSLARYAIVCQEAGLVPIVEPEILMDGGHDIETCYEVTTNTLNAVFDELDFQNVYLQGILLKPNMIVSGKDSIDRAGNQKVAEMTIKCLENTVPKEVPGIIFLSGGQEDAESLENLDSINKLAKETKMPWELSFSYGRGLQSSTLKKWEGKDTNLIEAQKEFISRCEQVSLAREGLA
jgi:fructose-bisphosphate aldolase class I